MFVLQCKQPCLEKPFFKYFDGQHTRFKNFFFPKKVYYFHQLIKSTQDNIQLICYKPICMATRYIKETTNPQHNITQQNPHNMSLTQPKINKDILQSLHISTPTSMFSSRHILWIPRQLLIVMNYLHYLHKMCHCLAYLQIYNYVMAYYTSSYRK